MCHERVKDVSSQKWSHFFGHPVVYSIAYMYSQRRLTAVSLHAIRYEDRHCSTMFVDEH